MPDHCIKNALAGPARWSLVLMPLLFCSSPDATATRLKLIVSPRTRSNRRHKPLRPCPPIHPTRPCRRGIRTSRPLPVTSPPATSRAGLPQLTWQTPDGWTEVAAGEMRVASFKIQGQNGKQADVSVIPLPGLAGSDDANVNRWRGQVGLPPVSPDELKKSAENVEVGRSTGATVRRRRPKPGQRRGRAHSRRHPAPRRHGVVFQNDRRRRSGGTAKAGVRRLSEIREIRRAANTERIAAVASVHRRPCRHGRRTGAAPAASPANRTGRRPPAGRRLSGGQFLVAKFMLTGAGGATAAVNVSSSAGEGGGLSPM